MTTETATDLTELTELAVLDDLRGVRSTLSVRRVFGDPHTIDGLSAIGAALGLVTGAVARLRHRRDREVGP